MKTVTRFVVVVVLAVFGLQHSYGWGNATHTYFAKKLGEKFGPLNMDEMYGSVLPDAFNFMFDDRGAYLYVQTHTQFADVLKNATSSSLRAVALGFASHNQVWGADFTAHVTSFTIPTGGYAIEKGTALAPTLITTLAQILAAAGMEADMAQGVAALIAPELGHDLIETGVDLLVKRDVDPGVGVRMGLAARCRPTTVANLLVQAYGAGLAAETGISEQEAAAIITEGEKGFQDYMVQYGLAFTLPEALTIKLLASQSAPVAEAFIEAKLADQLGAPVDITITPEQVAGFLKEAIAAAKPDYAVELAKTLTMIEVQLAGNLTLASVRTLPIKQAAEQAPEDGQTLTSTGNESAKPNSVVLAQNYPNPFNPSTTISFSVQSEVHVRVSVYNLLGQEVATLMNDIVNAGRHSVVWNAERVPSGVYICRIDAGGESRVRSMNLVR